MWRGMNSAQALDTFQFADFLPFCLRGAIVALA
jgi:hypothetical protein